MTGYVCWRTTAVCYYCLVFVGTASFFVCLYLCLSVVFVFCSFVYIYLLLLVFVENHHFFGVKMITCNKFPIIKKPEQNGVIVIHPFSEF